MNKTLAITTIALVAVVLGMSALVPALANQVEPDSPPGGIPQSEECQECDEELNDELLEITEEFNECMADAEDLEEELECSDEANEDTQEAFEEWAECREDNACDPTTTA